MPYGSPVGGGLFLMSEVTLESYLVKTNRTGAGTLLKTERGDTMVRGRETILIAPHFELSQLQTSINQPELSSHFCGHHKVLMAWVRF